MLDSTATRHDCYYRMWAMAKSVQRTPRCLRALVTDGGARPALAGAKRAKGSVHSPPVCDAGVACTGSGRGAHA